MSSKMMTSRTLSPRFPSPETPPCSEDDRETDVAKGWYSERVPRSSQRSRKRYVAAAALMPFSSGRTLPSKWDDAERWISSPVSVGNVSTTSCSNNFYLGTGVAKGSHMAQYQRRAKSKSGPLGPAGLGYNGGYNTFSPVLGMGVINSGKWRNSLAIESPASARVQLEGLGGNGSGRRKSCPGHGDPEWLDMWSGPLNVGDKDYTGEAVGVNDGGTHNNNRVYNGEEGNDGAVSRRDMATQMFPENYSSGPSSATSSPRSSISTNSPRPPHNNEQNMNVQTPEYEVKDVQVDKQISTTTRKPSPQRNEVIQKPSGSLEEDTKTRLHKEEARIIAWENIQKAKAESAVQKLEMKLEKKRTSTMEKIIEKLRRAEIKAQKMRRSLPDDGSDHHHTQSRAILRTTSRIPSFCRKLRLNPSIKSCVPCHRF